MRCNEIGVAPGVDFGGFLKGDGRSTEVLGFVGDEGWNAFLDVEEDGAEDESPGTPVALFFSRLASNFSFRLFNISIFPQVGSFFFCTSNAVAAYDAGASLLELIERIGL